MNGIINEPLEINITVPNGNYEVVLSLKAHSDTVFSVYTQQKSLVVNEREIKSGEAVDITFDVNVFNSDENKSVLNIQILTDGDITATAAVSPKD